MNIGTHAIVVLVIVEVLLSQDEPTVVARGCDEVLQHRFVGVVAELQHGGQ